jgi:hypothetical protein
VALRLLLEADTLLSKILQEKEEKRGNERHQMTG